MNKPLFWVSCLVGGVLVGLFIARDWRKPEDSPVPTGVATSAERAAAREAAAPLAGGAPDSRAQPAQPAPPAAHESAAAPVDHAPGTQPVVSSPAYARSVDSGVVNAVDAGEVFNKQIARPSTPDAPNQLGDAHREFEREARDEGWAYSMEAELQNTMINETSTGAFRMEHIECRTTICEVRISGNGDQADAVRAWSETLRTHQVNQQLFMNVSSTISSHERIDSIYIFRRPARTP